MATIPGCFGAAPMQRVLSGARGLVNGAPKACGELCCRAGTFATAPKVCRKEGQVSHPQTRYQAQVLRTKHRHNQDFFFQFK